MQRGEINNRISYHIVVYNWQRTVSFQSHVIKFKFVVFILVCRDPNTLILPFLNVRESLFVIILINWPLFSIQNSGRVVNTLTSYINLLRYSTHQAAFLFFYFCIHGQNRHQTMVFLSLLINLCLSQFQLGASPPGQSPGKPF